MQLADRLVLDAPRRTSDGYLAVRAKAARVGTYDYLAGEVGAPSTFKPTDVVKVYRDANEVFAADAVRSFIGRPITNDHPSTAVTAANWKDHARGTIMGAMRDGDYLAFDLVLMDAGAIAAVENGKRELSNGYSCQLDWTPGTAPDGQRYDARQVGIRGNHVALVDQGRAGPNCAIKDGESFALCDSNPAALAGISTKEPTFMSTITIDGLPVNLGDEAAVRAVIAKKDEAIASAQTALSDANAKVSTLTGEKTALEAQLADAKAALDPARLDAMVADRAALIGKVKAIAPLLATDGKTDADLRRAVVEAKLGDAAKAMDDAAIAGAFAVLAVDAKPVADAVQNIAPAKPAATHDGAAVVAAIRSARYA